MTESLKLIKTKPEQNEPAVDERSGEEKIDLSFDYSEYVMEMIRKEFEETGRIDTEVMEVAKENVPVDVLHEMIYELHQKSKEKTSNENEHGDRRVAENHISSEKAESEEMGNVGSHYSKFIGALVYYENFVRYNKVPNLCADASSEDLMESFAALTGVYDQIIDAATNYKEHREKVSFSWLRNKIPKMKNRLEYVEEVKAIAKEEKIKVSQFINFYNMNPRLAFKNMNKTENISFTWLDVITTERNESYIVKGAPLGKGKRSQAYEAQTIENEGVETESGAGRKAEYEKEEYIEIPKNATPERIKNIEKMNKIIKKDNKEGKKAHQKKVIDNSVAMSRISSLLGSTLIIKSRSAYEKKDDQEKLREFQEFAEGKSVAKHGVSYDPHFLKQASQLHLIDLLMGQKDRHSTNVHVEEGSEGRNLKLHGIDNDDLLITNEIDDFKKHREHFRTRIDHLPKLEGYVDKEMAERILALDGKILRMLLLDVLDENALGFLEARLKNLQELLNSLDRKYFVKNWTENIGNEMRVTEGNYINMWYQYWSTHQTDLKDGKRVVL